MRRKGFFGLAAGLCFLILVLTVLIGIPRTNAAPPVDPIEDAIVKGLAWLDTQQQVDGSWLYYSGPYADVDIATTGLVVFKYEERAKQLGKDPFDPAQYEYADNVINGLNYIFGKVISDSHGNHFGTGVDIYDTAIAMMALAASNAPSRVISAGILNGQTFTQALQGMVDWMAYAQNTDGCAGGGWGYVGPSPGWSDQSNAGYAAIGLGFAAAPPPDGFGLAIPPTVLTKLNAYIDSVQQNGGLYDGGSNYFPCSGYYWANTLKTGSLLHELALVGAPQSDPRVQRAIGFIQTYWNSLACNFADGCGWMGDYQAMFTLMKGLESFGIQNLTVGGSDIDWFAVVSGYIIAHQYPDGHWLSSSAEEGVSATINTAWALLTLEKAVPVVVSRKLEALSPAEVWVGLTNSDDVGLYFDILAEVLVDDHSGGGPQVVASEQATRVWGGSSGFNNAVKSTIPFNLPNPVAFPAGSTLSLRVSVRQACTAPRERYCIHVNECKARLWYNDQQARSGFDATIDGVNTHYFLQSNFVLGTSWGPGPKKTSDKGVGSRCSPFKSFGTWSIVPQ